MPAKKKVYVRFEGIIVPSVSGEGLAETDKAWLVEISIPEKYSGEQVWIAKSMVKPGLSIKDGDLIQGSVESWIFKKLDKKEVNEIIAKQDMTKIFPNKEIEVITPALEEKHIETKENFNKFIGKGMEFKEISVSLGEKVSVNFQSKNAQVGVVISVGGESIDDVYSAARNFVKDKLKEEAIRIRESML